MMKYLEEKNHNNHAGRNMKVPRYKISKKKKNKEKQNYEKA
jgi:hypothetical protein